MKSKNQRPKYYVAWPDNPEHNVSCPMLYAVYENDCFYADKGRWCYTGLHPSAFKHGHVCGFYNPCYLADVRAAFNNIKAHKRDS